MGKGGSRWNIVELVSVDGKSENWPLVDGIYIVEYYFSMGFYKMFANFMKDAVLLVTAVESSLLDSASLWAVVFSVGPVSNLRKNVFFVTGGLKLIDFFFNLELCHLLNLANILLLSKRKQYIHPRGYIDPKSLVPSIIKNMGVFHENFIFVKILQKLRKIELALFHEAGHL